MKGENNVSRITKHTYDHEEKQKRPSELCKTKEDEWSSKNVWGILAAHSVKLNMLSYLERIIFT